MLATLRERIPDVARSVRFGIVHVGCLEKAESFAEDLRATFGEREIIITPASPVLATHLGPGAWGWPNQLED